MNLLFLVHRFPYPPNKGDKTSTYNMLKYFSRSWRIFLGGFVDQPDDWKYLSKVEKFCAEAHFVPIDPRTRKLASLSGLLTGEPLTNVYYRNGSLQQWVNLVLAKCDIDAILVFSGCMAQYVVGKVPSGARSMFDPEDVDSEKWQALAKSARWPRAWLYRREARKVFEFERQMAKSFDVSVFVTENEAELFKTLAPEVAPRVTFRTQGVDADYFDPSLEFDSPYPDGTRALAFIGVMDYWPNVEAVNWFARDAFPQVRRAVHGAEFYIVGLNPSPDVRRLAETKGVHVTGGVADVRPYLQHAWAACLPLRTARGIQNKVLEAMAMEKPVIASPEAMTGINAAADFAPLVAETAADFAHAAIGLLHQDRRREPAARTFVREHFNWDTNLRRFEALLAAPTAPAAREERSPTTRVA